jgi:hypothetical protein
VTPSPLALHAAAGALAVLIGVAAADLAVQLGGDAKAAPPAAAAHRPVQAPAPGAAAQPMSAREVLGLPPRPIAPRIASARTRGAGTRPALPASTVAIPRQGVVAPVGVCQIVDGALEPPADVHRTCRWAGGAGLDAGQGTTVITGHINWVGQGTGALGNIGQLAAGNVIYTADGHGAVSRWRVQRVTFRNKTLGIDLRAFVGPTGPRALYLISCGGQFDPADASYVDNIYVRAVPAAAAS